MALHPRIQSFAQALGLTTISTGGGSDFPGRVLPDGRTVVVTDPSGERAPAHLGARALVYVYDADFERVDLVIGTPPDSFPWYARTSMSEGIDAGNAMAIAAYLRDGGAA